MYTRHFGLQYKPFGFTADPRFLWLNQAQRRKMAYLRHALLKQNGFALITGDVGTGKTLLAKGLAISVAKSASVITVPDPDMEKLDFFNYLAEGFGLDKIFESKADFLIGLKLFLRDADVHSRKVMLIIDEAHRLSHDMLQEIRLLSNIDLSDRMQLSTVLIGLPEIKEMLRQEHNRNVMQRITASIDLTSLDLDDVRAYILHRLRVAGSARGIFTGPALRQIHAFSGGNPRLINLLCDHALVTGFAAGKKTIDSKIIKECVGELSIPFFEGGTDAVAEESITADPGVTQETAAAENRPEGLPFSSARLSRIKPFGVAVATVVLLLIGGYSLRGPLFGLQAPETENEQALQDIVDVLESQPDGSGPDLLTDQSFGHEMGDEMTLNDLSVEQPPQETPEFDSPAIRKKIEVPAAQKIENSGGLKW